MFRAEIVGKHLYAIVRYVSVVFFGIKCSVTLSETFFSNIVVQRGLAQP